MPRIERGDLVHCIADNTYFGVGLVVGVETYDQTYLVLREGVVERFWDFELEAVDDPQT